jgi:hypothetical protein
VVSLADFSWLRSATGPAERLNVHDNANRVFCSTRDSPTALRQQNICSLCESLYRLVIEDHPVPGDVTCDSPSKQGIGLYTTDAPMLPLVSS